MSQIEPLGYEIQDLSRHNMGSYKSFQKIRGQNPGIGFIASLRDGIVHVIYICKFLAAQSNLNPNGIRVRQEKKISMGKRYEQG